MKTLFCQNSHCRKTIDPEKVRKGGQARVPKFCSRQCQVESFKEAGFYHTVLSRAGIAAQHAYKAEHGHVPGYEQRKAALQRPDRTNKRKRRADHPRHRPSTS